MQKYSSPIIFIITCALIACFSGCATHVQNVSEQSRTAQEAVFRIIEANGAQPADTAGSYSEHIKNNVQWTSVCADYRLPDGSQWDQTLQSIDAALMQAGFQTDIIQSEQIPPRNVAQLQVFESTRLIAQINLTQMQRIIRAQIAIVIDDLGHNTRALDEALAIDRPITYAVLPKLPKSETLAGILGERGNLIILHQPMESIRGLDPGPGAIYATMADAQVQSILTENLQSIPYCQGLNNHMGSRITTDKEKMRTIFTYLKANGYFFLDSLTEQNQCKELARELNFPIYRRDVFLDNELDSAYINGQIDQLAHAALKYRSAIGIGHFHPITMRCIREKIPELEQAGIQLVYLNELPK